MMWKVLHNVVPNCCDIKFKVTLKHGDVAIMPSLSKSSSLRNQSLYDSYRSNFAVQGPKLWNKVPPTVKADTSFDMYKCSLSNFLVLIPDNPQGSPVTAAVGQTRHPGGQISDDPSGSTDDLNDVTK